MSLSEYFENAEGVGILATADSEGNVDLAIYARPHMVDDENLVLIMAQKTSCANLKSNPKAAYMFMEKGEGHKGKRLHIRKTDEETDPEKVESLRRRKRYDFEDESSTSSRAVYFAIDKVRPIVGG
ncbi:MAG: pyridoxamine 5'-phosphate oxidase family protein [Planctomycetes bacterium]|nr:pyridoxamine 5'-phosphate oxidase family protein [Planctomycetota bacterium]MBL7186347.1 pyridoxamine 5'-phosphate oxidase family protein [Phycisphaerae bacterium]